MTDEVPKHERIWFRRGERSRLDAFPSVQKPALAPSRRWRRKRGVARRLVVWTTAALLVPILLIVAAGAAVMSGLGSDRLRAEAEALITNLAGQDIDAIFGPAGISLDASRFIALNMEGLSLAAGDGGTRFVEAGLVKFGVRFKPLLSGQIKIGSARIADATIVPSAISIRRSEHWAAGLLNADGLVDPDLVLEAVFRSVTRAFSALNLRGTDSIELENVVVVLGQTAPIERLTIERAHVERVGEDELSIDAEVVAAGARFAFSGAAMREASTGRIASLKLEADASPAASDDADDASPRQGTASLVIEARQGSADSADELTVRADARKLDLPLGDEDRIAGDLKLLMQVQEGTKKIEIKDAEFVTGRSQLDFHGALGPAEAGWSGHAVPSYRFELISDGSRLAPVDSSEPTLTLLSRISGVYDPVARRLSADEIGLRTGPGEAFGSATVTFGASGSPAIALALNVPEMPLGQVKQIWPWFAAPGARSWVLANVFGGNVRDSQLRVDLAQGRLGNGVPLNGSEVTGRFSIQGARFDVAGRIPPVRDAVGDVRFAGPDVDIALQSGTVYLPSGRTVAAKTGSFVIRGATSDPLVGALDILVEGEASAVTQLASYEPINALRQLNLKPEDFSGDVEGRVKADIPLRRNIGMGQLDWLVEMHFRNLAVAESFEGQKVTEANGFIRLQPTQIEIEAKAQLNGVPADLRIVEPLGGSGVQRNRDIVLELDDKARDRLLPGLSTILAGPVRVTVERGDREGVQNVTADLGKATVKLPWLGWSKGTGIPATVSFALTMDGPRLAVDRFRLEGQGFGASGSLQVADGSLARAQFSSVRLNKGDDASVDVRRQGRGYAIDVKGRAFDARSLVKQVFADPGVATDAKGQPTPVTVAAAVDTLTGFSGERLGGVKLSYTGSGSRVDDLRITATAQSGGAITITNGSAGSRRSVAMQSADAGAILRFLDIYKHMQGGRIALALEASGDGPLRGQIDARDFWIVNEPKLRSLVASAPEASSNGRIDVSKAQFERGFTLVEKGPGVLKLDRGVVRGPQIGATFQGTLYDRRDQMAITGTFMPLYGFNRIFGEIPLIGQILGNGRDRGLIGITFKLDGDVDAPRLQVNPLSAIAPGIFRSIFEFN